MSRIGRMPIVLPTGVDATIDGVRVDIKGPKGSLSREFFPEIEIVQEEGALRVKRFSDKPQHRSLHGLTRALLSNMVVGVSKGFEKKLELVGVGYRAAKAGNNLVLTVGYSHPVEMDPGPDLSVDVPAPNRITISGIDREKVGAFAANVREVRPPEPYKGKGIKYEGEALKRKAGKAGGK